MSDSWTLPVGMLFNVAPYAFLCYFPFKDKLKISIKKLLAVLSLPASAEFLISYFYRPLTYEVVQFVFFFFLAIYFLIYLLTVKMNIAKLIFVFLLNTDYGGIIILISNYLETRFFPQMTHIGGYSLRLNAISLTILAVTLPIGLNVMLKKVRPLLYLENKKAWGSLWIVPLMFFFILIAVACADNDNLIMSWQYIIITLTLVASYYTVIYVISEMLIETDENATLRENVRMVNMQLELQKGAYENLGRQIAETKAARHDLRHHLSVIEGYLQSDNYDELRKYLSEYRSMLPENKELSLCENSAANVIVLHYIEIAREEGISVTTNLYLPNKIGIADMDLCIVLGNCIENALEACRRMKSGRKYIEINSKIHGDMLGITIDNSFDGKVEEQKGKLLSRKRRYEEGLGVSSVQAVAAKYNGTALFTFNQEEFQASIMLNMRK